jgi:hypothetical protein
MHVDHHIVYFEEEEDLGGDDDDEEEWSRSITHASSTCANHELETHGISHPRHRVFLLTLPPTPSPSGPMAPSIHP